MGQWYQRRIPDIYDIIPTQDSNVATPGTNNSIPNIVEFEKPLQQTSTINASEILESRLDDLQGNGMNFTDSINFLSHDMTTQNPKVKTAHFFYISRNTTLTLHYLRQSEQVRF